MDARGNFCQAILMKFFVCFSPNCTSSAISGLLLDIFLFSHPQMLSQTGACVSRTRLLLQISQLMFVSFLLVSDPALFMTLAQKILTLSLSHRIAPR
jgi:hypothetical protein